MKSFTLLASVTSWCTETGTGAASVGALPPGGVFCVVYGLLTSILCSSSEIEQFVPLKMDTASEGAVREAPVEMTSWTPTLQRSSNKRDSRPA